MRWISFWVTSYSVVLTSTKLVCLASRTVTTAWTSSISFCFSSSSKFMYHLASLVFPALFWIRMKRICGEENVHEENVYKFKEMAWRNWFIDSSLVRIILWPFLREKWESNPELYFQVFYFLTYRSWGTFPARELQQNWNAREILTFT